MQVPTGTATATATATGTIGSASARAGVTWLMVTRYRYGTYVLCTVLGYGKAWNGSVRADVIQVGIGQETRYLQHNVRWAVTRLVNLCLFVSDQFISKKVSF